MEFFNKHEELKDLPLYIFGESYGGHYVPAVGSAVMHQLHNLRGIAVGNGLTVPTVQFQYYPELAYTYAKEKVNKRATTHTHSERERKERDKSNLQKKMNHGESRCKSLIVCFLFAYFFFIGNKRARTHINK